MNSSLLSKLNRLRLNPKSTHQLCETRSIYTGRYSKINLYSKISPLGKPGTSVVSELEKWTEKGRSVRLIELNRIIRDLRMRKRYSQALEISEWMGEKGVCEFTSGNHAVQLDLISRVHGLDSAETYFNNLSDKDKTEKTYAALLGCYARECLTDKSLSHMQKMKDLGIPLSSLPYNNIMSLYANLNQYEKIPEVMAEMKETGILPDNISYSICMNSYQARSDIDGMEKVLQEMEKQAHIFMDWMTYATVGSFYIKADLKGKALACLKKSEEKLGKNEGYGFNHLITLYASLGDKAEVMRLWERKKYTCKRYINVDYTIMLGSLVKLGELEEAEKLLKDWESSKNSFDFRVPNTLLIGYCQNGLVEKAREMLKHIIKKGKTPIPNSWGIIAAGYVKKHEMDKALECIKMAFELRKGNEGWRPNPKAYIGILGWLGEKGQVEEVEEFVGLLKTVLPMERVMYHALIQANVREGKEVENLLEKMKADEIEEDEETKKILSLRQVKAD